jgi:hypothetical protein
LFIKDLVDIRIIRPFKQTRWSGNMISTLRKFEERLFQESALTGFLASFLVNVLLFLILVRPSHT